MIAGEELRRTFCASIPAPSPKTLLPAQVALALVLVLLPLGNWQSPKPCLYPLMCLQLDQNWHKLTIAPIKIKIFTKLF